MAFYADTSALVKLVMLEPETPAMLSWIAAEDPSLASSDLTRTELRAVRRARADRAVEARAVLGTLALIQAPTHLFETAGRLDPPGLRTLDALHPATALELGDDLEGLVAYDDRLAEAARAHGIAVIAPR